MDSGAFRRFGELCGFKQTRALEQTAAPVRSHHRESTYSTYLKTPQTSRQSLQSLVTSSQRNPENNYYRQPGCRVFRRVSHLDHATDSLISGPESPLSRSRGFLRSMRSRIRMPTYPWTIRMCRRRSSQGVVGCSFCFHLVLYCLRRVAAIIPRGDIEFI
ncbi:hypothetical protein BDV11DRAFT_34613 [Aspergillus similis]